MADPSSAQQVAGDDLFFHSLIKGYISSPRFTERPWLEDRVKEVLADNERPFVLITAEPGAGKSAFLAWLASRNESWPRYFIRRDQASPLGPPGARSFLFQTGLQLAALWPDVFRPERIQVTIEQQIGKLLKDGQVIAAEVQKLIASPFMTAAMSIRQQVDKTGGNVVGLRIGEWIAEPRLIQVSDLQALALAEPATAIAEDAPGEMIVVLVDALDELRFQPEFDSLLDWLANCPELPSNVRLVITSRPDEDLLRNFRARQRTRIKEVPLDYELPHVKCHIEADLQAYARRLAAIPDVHSTLSASGQTPDVFAAAAVSKADGNLGYLDAIGRAIDRASAAKNIDGLRQIVALSSLPAGLHQLYGFFLHQLKTRVGDRSISIEDPQSFDVHYVSEWSELYIPIIGLLTVAAEPLSPAQIRKLAGIQAGDNDFFKALNALRQFLDDVSGRVFFYHSTVQQFLSDPATAADPQTRELYQDKAHCSGRISARYRRATGGWANAKWDAIDAYGWRHLSAHVFEATRNTRFSELLELYSAGYLAAKRKWATTLAELREDWDLILEAARQTGDFEAFIRFGYEISTQFSTVAQLQSRSVVRTAVRIAIRRGDEQALRRIASEIALIVHPLARADAQQSMLSELIAAMPESELVPGLISGVEALLAAIDPGEERDELRVAYIESLARLSRSGWEQQAREALANINSLPARIILMSTLARADAKAGRETEAVRIVAGAIAECKAFDMKDEMDDLIPRLSHQILGFERIDPLEDLRLALFAVIRSASALSEEDCEHAVNAVREQFPRLRDAGVQLRMEIFVFDLLSAGGHGELATRLVIPVLDKAVADPPGIDLLLPLFSTAVSIRDPERLDMVKRVVHQVAAEISEGELGSMVSAIASIMPDVRDKPDARDVLVALLRTVEGRCRAVTDDGRLLMSALPGLASAWARAGAATHAHELLEFLLAQLSDKEFYVRDDQLETMLAGVIYSPPETHHTQVEWFNGIWLAACEIGDRSLLCRTLDWLMWAAPRAITPAETGDVWLAAISAVDVTSDAEIAEHALSRLGPLLVECRDALVYHVTALLQLADAWAGLGNPGESLRLVNSALEWRSSLGACMRINVLNRACQLRAQQGDAAGCRELIEEAILLVGSLEGQNIREEMVRWVAQGVRALANSREQVSASAGSFFTELIEIARAIDQGESSLSAESAVVHAAAYSGIEVPTVTLAEAADHYLDGRTSFSFRPVLDAIAALHAAGMSGRATISCPTPASQAARDLFAKVQRKLDDSVPEHDWDRADICETCAALINLGGWIGSDVSAATWSIRCRREAASISDPSRRVTACAALTRVEASLDRSAEALDWLMEAIVASSALTEVYDIKGATRTIFEAWETIPDIQVRFRSVDSMEALVWRIPDPNDRDELVARIAVSVWADAQRLAPFVRRIMSRSGMAVVFDAMKASPSLPSGVGPGILYDLLSVCALIARPLFAGNALAAAQAAVRHRMFSGDVMASALRRIESMMLEIVRTAEVDSDARWPTQELDTYRLSRFPTKVD
jgi:hypothetical protein